MYVVKNAATTFVQKIRTFNVDEIAPREELQKCEEQLG